MVYSPSIKEPVKKHPRTLWLEEEKREIEKERKKGKRTNNKELQELVNKVIRLAPGSSSPNPGLRHHRLLSGGGVPVLGAHRVLQDRGMQLITALRALLLNKQPNRKASLSFNTLQTTVDWPLLCLAASFPSPP